MKVFALEQKNETDSTFMGVFDALDAAKDAAQADQSQDYDPEWEDRPETITWEAPREKKGFILYDSKGDYPAYNIVECELNQVMSFHQDR